MTPSAATLAVAHQVAQGSPGHHLPCPWCAASLKGQNLESHARKVHAEANVSGQVHDPVELHGVDRSALGATVVAALLATTAVPLLDTWVLSLDDPLGRLSLVLPIVAWIVVFLAVGDKFRGRLLLDAAQIGFRRSLGRGWKRLGFPLRVEYGPLTRLVSTMPAYEDDGPTAVESQRAGFYVRLRHGGRSITVGCPQATGFRKHWCSASGGPARARRSVDLWIEPVAFVGLQYALVRAGALRPRSLASES